MHAGYRSYGEAAVARSRENSFPVQMALPFPNALRSALLVLAAGACSTSSVVVDASTGTSDAGHDAGFDAGPAAEDSSVSAPSDRCATPQVLTFEDGEASARNDTSVATDEFASLDCESRGTAGSLSGPQHYYSVFVSAGATYSFVLNATFHSVLFGFDARTVCSQESLQRACRSGDGGGFASGLINPGTGGPNPGVVFDVPPDFAPDVDMNLILVVDSDGGGGAYELTVRETLP